MRPKILALTVGTAAGLFAATPACATDTFAQFAQLLPKVKIFTYTNANSPGVKAKITTASSSNTVLVSDLGTLFSPSIATVNLSATAASLPFLSGGNIWQLFSGSITFTLLAPQPGMSGPSVDALDVTFVDAAFETPPGGGAPTLQADSTAGSVITYASDFADLSGTTAEDFALSFSGASQALNLTGGRLPNFSFSGSGTFAADLPIPEPASWTLMLAGFGIVGGVMRSRRKTTAIFDRQVESVR